MPYFSLRSLPVLIDPVRLVPTKLNPRENVTRGATPSSLDDFIKLLDARFTSPSAIRANVEAKEGLNIVRLGFRLKLPGEIQLKWLRLSTEVFSPGSPNEPIRPGRIVSFLPDRVPEDLLYDGRPEIDRNGMIQWTQVSHGPPGVVQFSRFALGYQTRLDRIVWDFFPENGGPPLGSDTLMFVVSSEEKGKIHVLEAMQLCVEHSELGRGYFEFPPTTKICSLGIEITDI